MFIFHRCARCTATLLHVTCLPLLLRQHLFLCCVSLSNDAIRAPLDVLDGWMVWLVIAFFAFRISRHWTHQRSDNYGRMDFRGYRPHTLYTFLSPVPYTLLSVVDRLHACPCVSLHSLSLRPPICVPSPPIATEHDVEAFGFWRSAMAKSGHRSARTAGNGLQTASAAFSSPPFCLHFHRSNLFAPRLRFTMLASSAAGSLLAKAINAVAQFLTCCLYISLYTSSPAPTPAPPARPFYHPPLPLCLFHCSCHTPLLPSMSPALTIFSHSACGAAEGGAGEAYL